MSVFSETDHPRVATGQFTNKANTAPGSPLAAEPTGWPTFDDPHWGEVVERFELTDDERELLDEHLLKPGAREAITSDTLTTDVIAESQKGAVAQLHDVLERHDDAFARRIGAGISHGRNIEGKPVVRAHASTDRYLIMCSSDGDNMSHRVGGERYASAADIPAEMRKARKIAAAFEAERSSINDSIDHHEAYRNADARWGYFYLLNER